MKRRLQLGMATAELYNNLGHAYCQCGKPNDVEAARVHLERALLRNPKLPTAHYNLAVVYYRKSLAAKSLSAAQKARTPDLAREAEFLKLGIAAFREAVALGPVTGDMAFVGAALCAGLHTMTKASWPPPSNIWAWRSTSAWIPGNSRKGTSRSWCWPTAVRLHFKLCWPELRQSIILPLKLSASRILSKNEPNQQLKARGKTRVTARCKKAENLWPTCPNLPPFND